MKKEVLVLLLVLAIPLVYAVEIKEIFTIQKDVIKDDSALTSNSGKTTYFYAGAKLIASKDSNNNLEYHYQDRLGSDAKSKTLPFGQEISSGERFSFTGKELDSSGLYYFNARYYDSDIGRFSSIDPVKDNHPYSYVANNPMNLIDPDGKIVRFKLEFDYQQELAQRRVSELNSFLGSEVFSLNEIGDLLILNKKYKGDTDEQSSVFKLFKKAIRSNDLVKVNYLIDEYSELRINQFNHDRFEHVPGIKIHEILLSQDKDMEGYSAPYGEGGSEISFLGLPTFVHEMAHFVNLGKGEKPAVEAENLVRDKKRVYYTQSFRDEGHGLVGYGWTPEVYDRYHAIGINQFDDFSSYPEDLVERLDIISYLPYKDTPTNRIETNHPLPMY